MIISYKYFLGKRVHLGVCGSISAYKSIELLRTLVKAGVLCNATLTDAAQKFVTPLSFASLGASTVYTKMFEDESGDIFGHITPGNVADAMCIAPASATTISRIVNGSADEILSAQVLAFSGKVVIAPAMNPKMWANVALQENIAKLKRRGFDIVEPESGAVACGDLGTGKLAAIEDVYYNVLRSLACKDLEGKNVLVTLGPTHEYWDDVRYWTSPSTGYMGACIAIAAWLRGANVYAISGPSAIELPRGINRINVVSADDMAAETKKLWDLCDYGVFVAAVSDFAPQDLNRGKFKKSLAKDGLSLKFKTNEDILAYCGKNKKSNQKIMGFAAESVNLEEYVKGKLTSKNADIIAGNFVGRENSGFASKNNNMYVEDRFGRVESFESLPKADIAWELLTWLLSL